jgi:hypothetical protein
VEKEKGHQLSLKLQLAERDEFKSLREKIYGPRFTDYGKRI